MRDVEMAGEGMDVGEHSRSFGDRAGARRDISGPVALSCQGQHPSFKV